MTALKSADRLQDHMAGTYSSLRMGVGIIGVALPLVLWLGGWIGDGEPLRGSMSAYYYSLTMGDVFVGALVAVGTILYLYSGFSPAEDLALDLAGVFAVGVAFIPTDPPDEPGRLITLHGSLAVAFFVCIAYVCVFRASDTLRLVRDADRARQLRTVYRMLGAAMVVLPVIAALLASLLRSPSGPSRVVFLVEAAGVWVFALYWLIKSKELRETGAARLALEGKLHPAAALPGQPAGQLVQIEPDAFSLMDWGSVAGLMDSNQTEGSWPGQVV